MAITIIKQPVNVTAAIGTTAVFAVEATGDGLTYQWQYFTSNTNSWENSSTSGSKTNTLKVAAETHRNGYKYRCVITDANGDTVTTDEVTLTVAPIVITKQPTNRVRFAGDVVYYTVEAAGNGLTYQWEFKNATAGAQWGASGMTGNRTPSMTVEVTKARNGYQYRCKITDASGNVLVTDAAKLIVLDADSEIGFMSAQTMTAIGDAIRKKTEATGKIFPSDMAAMIEGLRGALDGITDIEVVTCSGSRSTTQSIPCSLSVAPVCVVIYSTALNTGSQVITAGIWAYGRFTYWYGASSSGGVSLPDPLSGGEINLLSGSTDQLFSAGEYRCVMWR